MTSLEDLAQLKALRPQQRDGGDADERFAALLSAYADRLESALGAALVRLSEAEGLLREVFEEFGPGCRDFSTWDTVEHFLDHPEPATEATGCARCGSRRAELDGGGWCFRCRVAEPVAGEEEA